MKLASLKSGGRDGSLVVVSRDLARSLSLVSIRVIETIPGKNLMALELPNAKRQTIKLSEILGSQVYHDAKSLLTMGLGKDIEGKPVVADLAKMPHVLVALQGTQALHDGHLKPVSEGTLKPAEYDAMIRDLVNFMVYMGEPAKLVRYGLGIKVLLFLLVFAGLAYMVKREYWRDVH